MNWTLAEKQREVTEAVIHAAWLRPESIIDDRPGWYSVFTPTSPHIWHNKVLRSHLTKENVHKRVKETLEAFSQTKGFLWVLSPDASPENLEDVLKAHGMILDHVGLGMVTDVSAIQIDDDPKITVETVGLHNVEDYAQAACVGWGNPPEMKAELLIDLARSVKDPEHKTLYYLARFEGRPAASGGLFPLEKSGYLLGSSVVPEFRGKGVYRALVKKRLEKLKELGITLATIQAMKNTSAPICRKLGFETVSENRVYKTFFK